MAVGAIIEHVGGVMGRSHALFGDPLRSGGEGASDAADRLVDAAGAVDAGRRVLAGLSGALVEGHRVFADDAASALTGLAGADHDVAQRLYEAAGTDRYGRTESGAAVAAAGDDAAVLAPYAALPAGERALVIALRRRVAQQQRVVVAYRQRDARMAALLRSTRYPVGGRAGAPTPFSFGGGIGTTPARRSAWSVPAAIRPATVLASRMRPELYVDGPEGRAASVPGGPAAEAVRAALSKRGVAYVWGAKGPSNFDCSGLTQWAWRQAGVQLGGDTYTQVTQGIPVPPGEVRAGDLIFPKSSWDGRGPGHVQLAISATQVVHAPQTGDVVRVAAIPASYVARRPVALL